MNWRTTEYNRDMQVIRTPNGGFYFDFPNENGRVNSIVADRKATLPFRPIKTVTIRYKITRQAGSPKFDYVDKTGQAGLPANFRPRISTGFLEDRYWPSGDQCAHLALTDGGLYTIKLRPAFWQDVNGHLDKSGFKATLTRNGLWTLSFGGNGNFEHGCYCYGGKARFELTQFSVHE